MPTAQLAPARGSAPVLGVPRAASSTSPFSVAVIVLLLGAHAILGIAGHLSSMVATAHAVVVGAVVLGVSIFGRRLDRIVVMTTYAALCDIFWRMSQSRAPWEFSKYLLIVGSLAVLIRFSRPWVRPGVPVAFIACLIPGMLMTMNALGPSASRELIVDSGLGAIALGIGALAFRQLILTEAETWNLGWVMLGPLITAMAITTYATLTTQGITFGSESNFDVTGGYGPNQVSSAMGLGILICLALSLQRRGGRYLIILAGVALWGTWATLLTFSRGGLYALVIAGCAMLLVGVTSRGARTRSLILLGVGIVGLSIMFSTVNDFSGNWLETRYEKSTSTQSTAGRTDLLGEDFQIFLDHPLFGVGVGESQFRHVLWGENIAAATHTEQTRILAEHGLLGVAALGLIVSMFISGYRHSITRWNRLLVVSSAAWALTTMLHAATRLGAVSLLFALSQLRVEPDPGDERLANLRSVAPGPSARPDQPPEGPTTTFSPGQTVSPLEHEGSLRSS